MNTRQTRFEELSNVDLIRIFCHRVLSLVELLPKEGKTYCNIGFFYIIRELGFEKIFSNRLYRSPLLANEMYDVMAKNFTKVSLDECKDNIESGNIYVAAMKGEPHGHIAIVYPMYSSIYSNKWGEHVPLVANIGKKNGIMGLNWAFDNKPDIFCLGKPA